MNRQDSNIPWWLIVLGLIFAFPAGVFLLLLKLRHTQPGNDSAAQQRRAAGTASPAIHSSPANEKRAGTFPAGIGSAPSGAAQKAPPSEPSLLAAIQKNHRRGWWLSLAGGVVSCKTLMDLIKQIVSSLSQERFPFDSFSTLGWLAVGLTALGFGMARMRLSRRQRLYLGAIGSKKSIFLSDLASAAGISEKRVADDLQKMLSDGALSMGYIDRASGRLVLTDKGYEQTGVKTGESAARVVQEATQEDKDRAVLLQIRAINDAIPGDEMSRKIDRIEEITGKILAYARNHPQKAGALRQFLNYYLPTTLKILNAYAQMDAQGVQGENITAAKTRIEGMMDKVVDGFEKQLDQLFQTDAMDIAADVEVLERMLENDGLGSSNEGISLTLGGSDRH